MSRARVTRAGAIAATLALAAGCPLPQPLPAIGGGDGSTITPPLILASTAVPAASVLTFRPDCPSGATTAFGATIEDTDVDDIVEARWFVDYTPQSSGVRFQDLPPASADGSDPRRVLTPFHFEPALYASGGTHHVVEVVVSNGFYPLNTSGLELPNRTPQPRFDVQVFRWFVVFDPAGTCPAP